MIDPGNHGRSRSGRPWSPRHWLEAVGRRRRSLTQSVRHRLHDVRASLALVWRAGPRYAGALMVLTITLACLPACGLWVNKLLIDAVTALIYSGSPGGLLPAAVVRLLAAQAAVLLATVVCTTAVAACRELLTLRLQKDISVTIFSKISRLSLAQIEEPATQDAMRRASTEAAGKPLQLVMHLLQAVQAGLTLASVSSLMALIGPAALPLVVLATVPNVIVTTKAGVESYRILRGMTTEARVQSYLGMTLTSASPVKELRVYDSEHYLLGSWIRYYDQMWRSMSRLQHRRLGWSVLAAVLSTTLMVTATILVLRRALNGALSVGDVSMFTLGAAQVQYQLSALLTSLTGLRETLLFVRDLFAFAELPEQSAEAGDEWQGAIERIEFDRVTFRYPGASRDVLRDVSFAVRAGEVLAIVGENGAGKTTLLKLLTRLYEPTSGRILLNGLDASRFSVRSVQRTMSVIFQDFGQYQLTARENIAISHVAQMGDDTRLRQAGSHSGVHDLLDRLPRGLDTLLGRLFSGGEQLSGGQWQRIALARLYFRPASVRIFDEPTSALDPLAEANAVRHIHTSGVGTISFVVSHRLPAVRLADRVIVLKDGLIVEAGSHDELLARGGQYAKMFRIQANAGLVRESLFATSSAVPAITDQGSGRGVPAVATSGGATVRP